ncbi:MAG: hypothetical protein PVSMB9_00490 [Candidatus Dormibacteria bacterium]
MFGSTKVKIAAGLATGALTLGAAGAYAAANNNTVSTANAKPVTLTLPTGATTPTFSLISLSGNKTLTLSAFKNPGQCVSTFAKNKDLALAPAAGGKLAKNFHGKLMSTVQSWCQQFNTKSTTDTQTADATDTTQTTTTDSTSSTDSTDSSSSTHGQSGQSHGHGHGRGSAND